LYFAAAFIITFVASLHSVQQLQSPPLALIGSPAGRYGLRAVKVFEATALKSQPKKIKKPRQPLCFQHVPVLAVRCLTAFGLAPLLHSLAARMHNVHK